MKKILPTYFSLALTCFIFFTDVFAQNGFVQFGQNRVQYRDFKWQFYETDNFNVYFYQGGQDIGKYVVLSSEKCLNEVLEKLDFRLNSKLDVVVYNDISDYHQTNIGINSDRDIPMGSSQIQPNKIFVYFNGDHRDIDRQIKEGIARVYLNKLETGTGFQEVIQNAVLLNLPGWFLEGLISYAGNSWNTQLDNQLKDAILSGRFRDLSKLSDEEMAFIGHSLFYYLETNFAENSVANLLYLVKINKNIDRAFTFVTGKNLNDFLEEWYYHFLERYKQERKGKEAFNKENEIENLPLRKKRTYYEAKLSPDGKKIAISSDRLGKWWVNIFSLEEDKPKRIKKGGLKTLTLETDLSSPMIAWSPDGRELSIIYERKDMFYHQIYDSEKFKAEKLRPMRNFQKIYGFGYEADNRNLVISGMQRSQIDLFRYYIPTTRVTNLTNDFYDDLQPAYAEIDGRKGVLFISNRPNDTISEARLDTVLPNGNFDVFFYDFNSNTQPLIRITNTPLANESHPQPYGKNQFTFLSDVTGVNNRFVGSLESSVIYNRVQYFYYTNENPDLLDSIVIDPWIKLDSAILYNETLKEIIKQREIPVERIYGTSRATTNFYRNIDAIHKPQRGNFMLKTSNYQNQLRIFKEPIQENITYKENIDSSAFVIKKLEKKEKLVPAKVGLLAPLKTIEKEEKEKPKEPSEVEEEKIIIYQSRFDGLENLPEEYQSILDPTSTDFEESSNAYKLSRTRQYFLKFMTEEMGLGVDNAQLFTPYQPFNPGNPVFNQPGINGMVRFGITDLFEDHKIHGGFRLPIGFRGSEFYATYNNYKKRWDKSLTYYRRADRQDVNSVSPFQNIPGTVNTRTNLVESQFSYPFDVINSLRFKLGFRNDRFITKATDIQTLGVPNRSQNWIQSKVEFVHDNTISPALNIRNGFRINIYYEFQKEVPTREDTIFNDFNVQIPEFTNGFLMAWGADVRHYQKIYKNIIWANRFAYSTSVGTQKLIYYMGGTDNLFLPNFNTTTPVNIENSYAFQTLAYNMRGFQQNIRNGNSYMVFNSELRIPLFATFASAPLSSQLLENFQIVGFFDIGTAWEGPTPFTRDNPLFEQTASNDGESVVIRYQVQKRPVVMATGIGVRTSIMGYFIRADLGWGFDSGKVNTPRLQLSLGYDF